MPSRMLMLLAAAVALAVGAIIAMTSRPDRVPRLRLLVPDLAGLWRRIWASGSAGAEVRLHVQRDGNEQRIGVRSADRTKFLKSPKLH